MKHLGGVGNGIYGDYRENDCLYCSVLSYFAPSGLRKNTGNIQHEASMVEAGPFGGFIVSEKPLSPPAYI